MGWLEKFGRFRSNKRYYIWDGVRRQLREYNTKGDIVSLYKYPFNQNTKINGDKNDDCVLSITFYEPQYHILKLKAANYRDRDSWIRVLNNNKKEVINYVSNEDYIIQQNNNNKDKTVDNNYEEYRHLRMINRLKWSTLFTSLKATHKKVQIFRQFIISQNKLQRCSRREIELKLNNLFIDKDSPILHLFNSFTRLFLEPFYKININELEIESIDSIISLCVDDLSSFLKICQNRLINLLIPSSLRILSNNNNNNIINNVL